jgi:ubiquinone/menaquinone biosynthesis C-methylase UbiE
LGRIKDEFIGVRGSGRKRFDLYEEDMEKSYSEMARVLKPGGKASIVLGNVTFQGQELDTVKNCIAHCERYGLRLTCRIDKLIYGLYNVMMREWILIFEKPENERSATKKPARIRSRTVARSCSMLAAA